MNDNKVQFNIQRVYLKDLSFESPMTPDIFTNMSSSPKVGFNFESNIKRFLNVHCSEIVFPYARENVSSIIQRGGFPPLFLSPIDFHTIYQNELDKRKDN